MCLYLEWVLWLFPRLHLEEGIFSERLRLFPRINDSCYEALKKYVKLLSRFITFIFVLWDYLLS